MNFIGLAEKLKIQTKVIREVGTLADAWRLRDKLASRTIGGICVKNLGKVDPVSLLPDPDLWDFMQALSLFTATTGKVNQTLKLRHYPRKSMLENVGDIVRFNGDLEFHYDGIYEEFITDTGKLLTRIRQPIARPEDYRGVSHHFTLEGRTTFSMVRLLSTDVERIQPVEPGGSIFEDAIVPTIDTYYAQSVKLEKGDYLALHSYPVNGRPIYAHATSGSSDDRLSIVYNPVPATVVIPGWQMAPVA